MKAAAALQRGELVKKPCFVCQSWQSEMHHADYGKPLDVIWVCRRHHRPLFHAKWPCEEPEHRARKLEAERLRSKQLAARKALAPDLRFFGALVDLREF
jgi:hypothetical protein